MTKTLKNKELVNIYQSLIDSLISRCNATYIADSIRDSNNITINFLKLYSLSFYKKI